MGSLQENRFGSRRKVGGDLAVNLPQLVPGGHHQVGPGLPQQPGFLHAAGTAAAGMCGGTTPVRRVPLSLPQPLESPHQTRSPFSTPQP